MSSNFMISTHCAICKGTEDLTILYPANFTPAKITGKRFSARLIPDRMHYTIVRCKRCSLIFSNPIFPQKIINELYKKSDFLYQTEASYLGETYISYFKKVIEGKITNMSVLDIGCGNGFFLNELQALGVKKAFGVEPSLDSVEKASDNIKKRIKFDILREGLFKKNSFDVICCFHTLDHIVDVNEFLTIVYSLLKKGGKVFFIVHNTDGLSVKLFGEKSVIFDIEHIYLFNKDTLSTIFSHNKFKVNHVFDITNNYPLSYWTKLFPMPISLKKIVLKFLQATKLGSIPIRISAGNIGIYAKK